MAEDLDVAKPAVSMLDRLPMRAEDGEIRAISSSRSRARFMPPTSRSCAPWLRNSMRPISAI